MAPSSCKLRPASAAAFSARLSSTSTSTINSSISSVPDPNNTPISTAFAFSELPPSVPAVEVFNFNSVDLMQWVLESIHYISPEALPWFATLAITTFLFRSVVTFPTAVYQERCKKKLKLLRPIIQANAEILKHKIARESRMEGKTYELFMKRLHNEHNNYVGKLMDRYKIRPGLAMAINFSQIPFWISTSLAIQKMAAYPPSEPPMLPADGFINGGMLWFTDLTMPDTTMIIPILNGLVYWYNIERNYRKVSHPLTRQKVITNVLRCATLFMTYVSCYAPVALPLYWLSSGTYTAIQNFILDNPKMKDILKTSVPKFELPQEAVTKSPQKPLSLQQIQDMLQQNRWKEMDLKTKIKAS